MHLETCLWKCEKCSQEMRDAKSIRRHRNNCGKEKKSTEDSPGITKKNREINIPM